MMKKFHQSPSDENPAPPAHFLAILTVVMEVAERRNENISDIPLQLMSSALLTANETALMSKAAAH